MSKVDEHSRPDWTKVDEGTVLCDSRCLTCSCWNIPGCPLDTLESSWGSFTRDNDDVEYAVFQIRDSFPYWFYIGLCPCFFIHFSFMACIPMTEAIVIGFNRRTNQTFAEVRVKSMCSGWVTQFRKQIAMITVTTTPGGFFETATVFVNVFSDDAREPLKIPLKCQPGKSMEASEADIVGFARAANQIIEKSRREGRFGGAFNEANNSFNLTTISPSAPPLLSMDREETMFTTRADVYSPDPIVIATAVIVDPLLRRSMGGQKQ